MLKGNLSKADQFREKGGTDEALAELGGTIVDEAGTAYDGTQGQRMKLSQS